jgi:hypothetical protein
LSQNLLQQQQQQQQQQQFTPSNTQQSAFLLYYTSLGSNKTQTHTEKSRAEQHVVVDGCSSIMFYLLEPYLCFSFDSSSERGQQKVGRCVCVLIISDALLCRSPIHSALQRKLFLVISHF